MLSYAAENTDGTLPVRDDPHMANMALLGQDGAANFATTSEGYFGNTIVDPAMTIQHLLTQPHA